MLVTELNKEQQTSADMVNTLCMQSHMYVHDFSLNKWLMKDSRRPHLSVSYTVWLDVCVHATEPGALIVPELFKH